MIEGVQILPEIMRYPDDRGVFSRVSYPQDKALIESYTSVNKKNVFRGLHYQKGQNKAVYCLAGEIEDYILDLRETSPTYGELMTLQLPRDAPNGVWIPDGCAHGFKTLDDAIVLYIMDWWFDPDSYVGVKLSGLLKNCIVSEKDKLLPTFIKKEV